MPLPRPDDADYQALLDGSGDAEMSAAECSRLQQQQQQDERLAAGELQVEVGKGRRSKLSQVAGYIILTEFCERLAYYGFSGRFSNARGSLLDLQPGRFQREKTHRAFPEREQAAHAVF